MRYLKIFVFVAIFSQYINGTMSVWFPHWYWIIDIFTNAITPFFVFLYALRVYPLKEIGFDFPHGGENLLNFFAFGISISLLIPLIMVFVKAFVFHFSGEDSFFYGFSHLTSLFDNSPFSRTVTIIYAACTAGILEEIIYKGILVKILTIKIKSTITMILLISLIFAGAHWENGFNGFLIALIYSLSTLFLYIYSPYSKNITLFIIGHFLYDILCF